MSQYLCFAATEYKYKTENKLCSNEYEFQESLWCRPIVTDVLNTVVIFLSYLRSVIDFLKYHHMGKYSMCEMQFYATHLRSIHIL